MGNPFVLIVGSLIALFIIFVLVYYSLDNFFKL